jgi:hypothetical protein
MEETMDFRAALEDVRRDIEKLRKIERSLMEAVGDAEPASHANDQARKTRVTPLGAMILSKSAQLRWLVTRRPPDTAAIKKLQAELIPLRAKRAEEKKLARRRNV